MTEEKTFLPMRQVEKLVAVINYSHPAWNMALDEALLRCAQSQGTGHFIVRFYGWDRPSLSMGYFQRYSAAEELLGGDAKRWFIVRRPTGGGIVRHGKDFTYSLIYPAKNIPVPNDYQFIHSLLRKVLLQCGHQRIEELPQNLAHQGKVTQCFAQPSAFDLMQGQKKIAGAAQKRSRGWILHQGSVQLGEFCDAKYCSELESDFVSALEKHLESAVVQRGLTKEEESLASDLFASRYNTPAWNRKF